MFYLLLNRMGEMFIIYMAMTVGDMSQKVGNRSRNC